MSLNYAELFRALRPEASLVLGALVALGLDLAVFRRHTLAERLRLALWIGALAVGVAIVHVAYGARGTVFGGVLVFDNLAVLTRLGVLGLALLTLGVTSGARVLRHPAEYVAILLFATTGFTLMAAANQLLLAFLAIELASLSLYILAGYDKSSPASAEAALKYFLFGGMSAAFLLFGFSLIYGLTGSIELPEIAKQLGVAGLNPLVIVALVMILVAFGFKAAAAPFHLWAPDAYQGAPVPSAALIASASKLAGFALFARLLWHGLGPVSGSVATFQGAPGWLPVAAVVALASMLLGNLGALAQSNLRRLLAYSAIAHAGVLLLGVIVAGPRGLGSGVGPLFYYAATYGIATVGAFGVIAVLERADPSGCQNITDLAGLYRRSPLLAGCLAVFILSLAGIPPLAGFFGKFLVFAAALKIGGVAGVAGWLAFIAIGLSGVALYYYLIVLKQALVAKGDASAPPIATPLLPALVLLVCAALLVALGLAPSVVIRLL
ncbi:MAG: NADH-quinone oxidoreductase subunit N [Verrucomicrobia bacterium]|nr:NADH-quinone oxidoreductase subunit N [Verrucomicrobiota bacterium]